MGSKSPNILALVLPLLFFILFALSSHVMVVESIGRKLAWAPIVWTPGSLSCGASPAVWYRGRHDHDHVDFLLVVASLLLTNLL
ncbi:unnamed protein product, partial [Cochlearia groenlandica]